MGRGANGYHLLDSLAVFPAVGDRLTAAPAHDLSLDLTGEFADALSADPDNLVLRAARTLHPGAGARLTLEKNLPVASGIGGGSADAAAALRLLSRLWALTPTPKALAAMAEKLGADVPVCLASRPTRMQGIGDVLMPAPTLPEFGMVLINPGVEVSTPAVFRARTGAFSPVPDLPPAWPDATAMAATLRRLTNDLQGPAMALCPPIGAVLQALADDPACRLARMSGSGATCFGLFDDAASAADAAGRLARGGWWVWGGAMSQPLPDHAPPP